MHLFERARKLKQIVGLKKKDPTTFNEDQARKVVIDETLKKEVIYLIQ